MIIFGIYFFLLGIIVGSFLNVVILRYNTGKTIGGRSFCMSCKTQLTWRHLIPVLSFLFQKGRCSTCNTRLNWQYPFVELVTGVLFLLNFFLWFSFIQSSFVYWIHLLCTTIIISLLIVIFVYDMRHKIIPDVFAFSAWGVSVLYVFISKIIYSDLNVVYNWGGKLFDSTRYVFSGCIFYFLIWILWKISKGRMIGLGDAKLLLTIGTVLGFVYGLSAIFISVWIGTIYVLYILLKQGLSKHSKHITMKTEIPFGPFLILGFLIVYFTQIDVTNISLILENFS